MRKRLFVSTAMLACTAVVAIPAEGPAPLVSAPVAVDSTHEVPSARGRDAVLVWNRIFNAAVLATTPAPNSLVSSRSAALVAAAVFDAVNGVDRRYKPIHVTARAPSSTSARAAAIQ